MAPKLHDEDAIEEELSDLIKAANAAHGQDNPCTPANHKVLTRLVVITSRMARDIRVDIASLPEKIVGEINMLIQTRVDDAIRNAQTKTREMIDKKLKELEDAMPKLPGRWNMLRPLGGTAVGLYAVYVAREVILKLIGANP